MIATLTGDNGFGLSDALRQLTKQFVAAHGDMALEQLDGETAEFERLQEALVSAPFLSAKKLVVLRAPGANKQFTGAAEQLLGNLPETNDVVLVEPKLDKRLSYYKYLKKATDFREFPALDSRALVNWLAANAKAADGSLSISDAAYLVERIGENQMLLSNELEKLLLYDPKITRQSIDLLTERSAQSSIFELLEAAFAGRKTRTLELYEEQRLQKVDPLQIIAMLSWQLHVLALLTSAGGRSTDDIAREAKLNPYVVRKSANVARHLSLAQVKTMLQDLQAIDTQARRTSLDLDDALKLYLIALL